MKRYTNATEEDIVRELKPYNDEVYIKYIRDTDNSITGIRIIYSQYSFQKLGSTYELDEVMQKLNFDGSSLSKYVGNEHGASSNDAESILLMTIFHRR
jgi:hypothetical protein